MVEVFKTNVKDQSQANMLLDQIHKSFVDYKANFDLEDCDKILRVKSTTGSIHSSSLINLLKYFGYNAEVLPDNDQSIPRKILSREPDKTYATLASLPRY